MQILFKNMSPTGHYFAVQLKLMERSKKAKNRQNPLFLLKKCHFLHFFVKNSIFECFWGFFGVFGCKIAKKAFFGKKQAKRAIFACF